MFLGIEGAGFVQIPHKTGVFMAVGRGNAFSFKIGHTIRGRVVDRPDEVDVAGNIDAALAQREAHLRLLCHGSEGAGLGLPMLAAAGAAIIRGFVRVVLAHRPMADKDDEPGKSSGEADDTNAYVFSRPFSCY